MLKSRKFNKLLPKKIAIFGELGFSINKETKFYRLEKIKLLIYKIESNQYMNSISKKMKRSSEPKPILIVRALGILISNGKLVEK